MLRDPAQLSMCDSMSHNCYLVGGRGWRGGIGRKVILPTLLPILPFPPVLPYYSCDAVAG
jgi:hypothetical protein